MVVGRRGCTRSVSAALTRLMLRLNGGDATAARRGTAIDGFCEPPSSCDYPRVGDRKGASMPAAIPSPVCPDSGDSPARRPRVARAVRQALRRGALLPGAAAGLLVLVLLPPA